MDKPLDTASVLADKFRPISPSEVVGQDRAVKAMLDALGKKSAHSFLLSGPSGTGKTTLARIGVTLLGAERMDIDAATHTGVDAMREVQEMAHYQPLAHDTRAIVVDEAHRLSPQAWDSLLRIIEEPPPHVFWFFCTTEPSKVPATIRNRCVELKLQPLGPIELTGLLEAIAVLEWGEDAVGKDVIDVCVREAGASARKAIVNLSMCHALQREQARALLRTPVAKKPVADLCKLLLGRGTKTWLRAVEVLDTVTDDPEAVRINVCNYLAAVLSNAKTDQDAIAVLNVLEHFSTPYHPGERRAPLLRSVGRCLFGG